jgi:hypothetical protein
MKATVFSSQLSCQACDITQPGGQSYQKILERDRLFHNVLEGTRQRQVMEGRNEYKMLRQTRETVSSEPECDKPQNSNIVNSKEGVMSPWNNTEKVSQGVTKQMNQVKQRKCECREGIQTW